MRTLLHRAPLLLGQDAQDCEVHKRTRVESVGTQTSTGRGPYAKHLPTTKLMVARLAREHGVEAAIRRDAQASFPEAPPFQPVTVQH